MIAKVGFAKRNDSSGLFHPTLRMHAERKHQRPIDHQSLYCSYMQRYSTKFKSYSLHYPKACNEFTGLISASLRPGNIASFDEMLPLWRAVQRSFRKQYWLKSAIVTASLTRLKTINDKICSKGVFFTNISAIFIAMNIIEKKCWGRWDKSFNF